MQSPKLIARAVTFVLILLAVLLPLALLLGSALTAAPAAPRLEATRLAAELDRLLQLRLRETFTIAALPSLRAFAASDPATRTQRATVALNELQAWVAADTPVREAFVVDLQGVTILSTGPDWNRDWIGRVFVKSALAGQLDVSPPSHDVNEYSQYYASPILDNRGNVAGALIARVAAQEMWGAVNSAGNPANGGAYAVLIDENGVRLADGGDQTRILASLAPLTVLLQTRLITDQTYGAQTTILRATNLARAAQTLAAGKPEALTPGDFAARAIAAQRLVTKPWTVLVVVPPAPLLQTLQPFGLPLLVGLVCAGLAAFALSS